MIKKLALEKAAENGIALTFDDVRLKTGHSELIPSEVNIRSKFSRNVSLKIPIVSAAMDTVTEYKLSIELAKNGGLGVIHRNLSIEEQARQVAKVKYHLNGLIDNPICIFEMDSVVSVLAKRRLKGYSFYSFPVINTEGKIVGIVTENDFDFSEDNSLTIKDIMTPAPLTAPEKTSIEEAYGIMRRTKKKSLPLVSEDGKVSGMYVFSDVKRIMTGSAEMYNIDGGGRLMVAAAVGVGDEALERVKKLVESKVDVIVIDTAHGDTKSVIEALREIKRNYNVDVVVGNISSGESARKLVDAGADGIKIGQGPGSICTTRIVAGIGVPQVSAVYDCAMAIEGSGIPICADGGLKHSGDIPIAIAAGAHSVMVGTMLAGTEEAPGEVVFIKGRKFKSYRGMGSLEAMKENKSARERYLQEDIDESKLVPEGIEGVVPYRGNLGEIIFQYIGGLRNGMGYVGAISIEDLRNKGEFIRITHAGFKESHPHDVEITKDAPNYERDD